MIRFIHCADLHLDSSFVMEDAAKAAKRRNELRNTFTRLINEARTFGAHFVFIAGDLFDRRYVTKNTLELLSGLFSSLPECRFVISPGNHDFYSPDSVWEKTVFPDNVYIFKSEKLETLTFENVGEDAETVKVSGYAFTSQSLEYSPLAGDSAEGLDGDSINLLCAHADIFSKNTTYCPISVEQIARSAYDYVALGHVHNGGEILCANGTFYGYSGSLEAQSFHDLGERGAIFVKLEKNEDRTLCESEFVPMASRVYALEKINVTGALESADILRRVSETAEKLGYGERTLLRLVITGEVAPRVKVPVESIKAIFADLFDLEIIDETVPLFDCDYLAGDLSIRGALFRELLPKLRSEDERERAVASKALRYGLAALSGSEVIDFE